MEMLGGFLSGVKRFILWDYPRASRQSDVMVGLILAFIFLTPRGLFHDQPRTPVTSASNNTVVLQDGATVSWIGPELLAGVPESQLQSKACDVLTRPNGAKPTLIKLQPVYDSDRDIIGYMAFTKP
jgi:hypothetical protein